MKKYIAIIFNVAVDLFESRRKLNNLHDLTNVYFEKKQIKQDRFEDKKTPGFQSKILDNLSQLNENGNKDLNGG